jgi:hypothetical protein
MRELEGFGAAQSNRDHKGMSLPGRIATMLNPGSQSPGTTPEIRENTSCFPRITLRLVGGHKPVLALQSWRRLPACGQNLIIASDRHGFVLRKYDR